jgi:L-threonylcarbamoyladenylate synthase
VASFTDAALQLQKPGCVGIVPTDTVYGLVCHAADQEAVKRLYGLKGREGKPGTIIAATLEQLVGLGLKARYLKAVEQYWPGPISIIIPCGAELEYLHEGIGSLAVRLPDKSELQGFLRQVGPLLTSSANHTGKPVANTVAEAKEYFNDSVDFYVDGGDLSGHEPSTVIRIVDDAIEVLRKGAVTINEAGRIRQ